MSIFLKHILRNIKENMGRTSLILFSLFGVGLIISISLGMVFTISSFVQAIENVAASASDYIVESTTDEAITPKRLNETGIKFDSLGIADNNYGYYYDSKKSEYVSTPLLGLKLDDALKLEMLEIDKKENISLNENEIIISKQVAKKLKLKTKDVINYYDENGNIHSLTVKYIAKDKGVFVHDISFVSNEETYLKITGNKKIEYQFLMLKYLGNEKIENLTKKLYSMEDDYGLNFETIKGNAKLTTITSTPVKIGVVAVLLIFVVVYFTINSIIKIIMKERIPVIGTFRSVGATIKKVNSILLAEMATYGLIGGLLGSLAGVGLIKGFFKLFELVGASEGIEIAMPSYGKYSLYVVIITTLLLIAFQIVLSIYEIINSSKISIKDCIFNKKETVYKYSKFKFILGVFFLIVGIISLLLHKKLSFVYYVIGLISFFVSISLLLPFITKLIIGLLKDDNKPVLEMSKHTVNYNKLQISSNIIATVMLTVSLIMFSLLTATTLTYKSKLDLVKTDLYIESSFEDFDVSSEIASLNNVKKVSSLYSNNINGHFSSLTFANNKIDKLMVLYSDDYKKIVNDSNLLEVDYNVANRLKENEVIVSNYFRDKYNLKINDIVVLKGTTKTKNFDIETPINLKVVGFADTSKIEPMSILLNEKMAIDGIGTFDDVQYFIQINNKDNIRKTKKEIQKKLTYEMPLLYTQKEHVEFIKKEINNNFENVMTIVLIIMGVSLIGIINNQTVCFLERKKEFAILYSTSMSRKQINNMILLELLLSYLCSSILAIIFSLFIIRLLKYTLDFIGLYMNLSFSIIGVVLLLIVIGLLMSVIYLVMKRKIKKMNIVEELKYE